MHSLNFEHFEAAEEEHIIGIKESCFGEFSEDASAYSIYSFHPQDAERH